jgi:hypothetical protein
MTEEKRRGSGDGRKEQGAVCRTGGGVGRDSFRNLHF